MINYENIKTWDDFKVLELTEQVRIINELMAKGHSIPQISESIGAFRTTIGSHFKKNGYKRVGDEYKPAEDKIQVDPGTPKKERSRSKREVAAKGKAAR